MINSERLNQRLNLIANIAVIAGIVFLAIELQQSNKIARASIEIDIKNNFAATNEAVYTHPELAELLEKCTNPNATFTGAERHQVNSYVYQIVNSWLAIEEAFVNDMVSEATYGTVEDDVRFFLKTYPGMSPFFQGMLNDIPSLSEGGVFRTIDALLRESKRPSNVRQSSRSGN